MKYSILLSSVLFAGMAIQAMKPQSQEKTTKPALQSKSLTLAERVERRQKALGDWKKILAALEKQGIKSDSPIFKRIERSIQLNERLLKRLQTMKQPSTPSQVRQRAKSRLEDWFGLAMSKKGMQKADLIKNREESVQSLENAKKALVAVNFSKDNPSAYERLNRTLERYKKQLRFLKAQK